VSGACPTPIGASGPSVKLYSGHQSPALGQANSALTPRRNDMQLRFTTARGPQVTTKNVLGALMESRAAITARVAATIFPPKCHKAAARSGHRLHDMAVGFIRRPRRFSQKWVAKGVGLDRPGAISPLPSTYSPTLVTYLFPFRHPAIRGPAVRRQRSRWTYKCPVQRCVGHEPGGQPVDASSRWPQIHSANWRLGRQTAIAVVTDEPEKKYASVTDLA